MPSHQTRGLKMSGARKLHLSFIFLVCSLGHGLKADR